MPQGRQSQGKGRPQPLPRAPARQEHGAGTRCTAAPGGSTAAAAAVAAGQVAQLRLELRRHWHQPHSLGCAAQAGVRRWSQGQRGHLRGRQLGRCVGASMLRRACPGRPPMRRARLRVVWHECWHLLARDCSRFCVNAAVRRPGLMKQWHAKGRNHCSESWIQAEARGDGPGSR